MSRMAAVHALAVHARNSSNVRTPEPWQASDLITDLLKLFPGDVVEEILHRVERDYDAERVDAVPYFPGG
ncbi:hypothetical protein EDD90_2811 [Streptomyces sp. Ag109_O5-1]|uniref:hypothetical protein n=1 Tax=Streptomyces sp. Ag109_O5-1 TaxID=1938851 RepID=UPI000F506C74|nr:hypothetical protein [Streptomyces sp. Ag109_O5-1]RPE39793.1 hypothetical protein EDD90_2811 [Streptomyces sp. Ag109_O5-1]